jgi:hypothetical protein
MRTMEFSEQDLKELRARGVSVAEVARQLQLFEHPPGFADLDRSCALGDGIEVVGDEAAAMAAYEAARRSGRLSKFVPASGAATRMCQAPLAVQGDPRTADFEGLRKLAAEGDAGAAQVEQLLRELPRFPFYEALKEAARKVGVDPTVSLGDIDVHGVAAALVGAAGLGYADLPKGLLLFHRYPEGPRTAFEDQLAEAAELVGADDGKCRVHFTVSAEHEPLFADLLGELRGGYAARGIDLLVDFSTQKPSTDTIAVDLENQPFRDDAGALVFRPGGHGALLQNLCDRSADITLIQNIDNIRPADQWEEAIAEKKLLIGRLVQLQEECFAHLAALDGEANPDPTVLDAAERFARTISPVGVEAEENSPRARRQRLIAALDRPLRVCSVVENLGDPGGGPFWVRSANGSITRQIVEEAQVDSRSERQREIYLTASHFNPAILVCGVRDWRGRAFDLDRFVDSDAVFISRKSKDGRDLKALELPGLWNGSMAGWSTLFVQIGSAAFAPVKTLVDLLQPAHQPL